MYELVLSDFALIVNMIQEKTVRYDLVYRKDFEISGYLYSYLMNTLNSIEVYCDSDRYKKSIKLILGRMDIAVFHMNITILYQDSLRNKATQVCPGQLWTMHSSKPDCRASLEYIIKTIVNASVAVSELCLSNIVPETENDMHWVWGENCLNEYNFALHNAKHEILRIANRIERNLDPEWIFNYDKVLAKMNDIRIVNEMTEKVAALLTSYSQHHIRKLDMANVLINLLFSKDNYDRIFWILDKYAFNYIASKTETMEENIQRVFSDTFRVLETLMPYCNDDETEQRLRNLSLWRYPMARLDVQDIISYKYTSDESWELWSPAVSFKEMMNSRLGENVFNEIVTSYSSVLRERILEIKSEFMKSLSRINSAIDLLVDDLKTFEKDNTINRDFIL